MKLLVLSRHGQSLLNVANLVNGDPALDRGLSPLGEEEARNMAAQIAHLAIDACVTSEFPRAQRTAQLALGAREVPWHVDRDLNDVRIGDLEGETVDAYRAWKAGHTHADPFPAGESLDDAARRYADAFERLLGREEQTLLCVCHEIPVRYAVNAAAGSSDLDRPLHDVRNATPYLFDAEGLRRAIVRLRAPG